MKFISANNGLRLLFYSSMLASFPCTALARAHASPFGVAYFQQNISGTISDSSGPLPGVTVMIKGTTRSAISDNEGKFSIVASPGEILVFSFLGYRTVEVAVGSQMVLSVTLVEDVTQLDEVEINAGYYSVRQKESTGSISRITAKDIETQPVTNPLAAMQGRMAGVDISQATGTPGGNFNIKIRGINSLRGTANEPLYIIDGVPYASQSLGDGDAINGVLPALTSPLNAINPSDIENIEVLKDADATAIYGSRGANGVVLITTKKGKAGTTKFSFQASTTAGTVVQKMNVLNTEQYLQMRKEGFANDGITEYPADAYDVNGTWSQNRYTNWQKELLGGTSYVRNLQGSVSGGAERTQFMIGGTYRNETTVTPDTGAYSKGAVHTSITHTSADDRFKLNFSANYSSERNTLPGTDLSKSAYTLAPNAPALYDNNGDLNWENGTFENPLAYLKSSYRSDSETLFANALLSYQLKYGFEVRTSLGYNESSLTEYKTFPSSMYNPALGVDASAAQIFNNDGMRHSWIVEPQLNWKTNLNKLSINALAGTTFLSQLQQVSANYGMGFASDALIHNIAAASMVIQLTDEATAYKYNAIYSRLNFNYDGKYIINATGRRDGSSRFGPGNRFANFWALGGAWLFHKEALFDRQNVISYGKIRTSYGTTGSDQIGDYQYLNTYAVSPYQYGGITGLQPSRLFNPNFGWETNKKWEIALELGLFNDRILWNTSYFRNRSSNQLVGLTLPGTTGFSSVQSNLGATVENEGWEIGCTSQNVKTTVFSWTTSLNLTVPRNRLVAFPGLESSTYSNTFVIGKPVNVQKLYEYTGIDQQTGTYTFRDYNNDGQITLADRQATNDPNPKFFGGFSNTLSYKNWNLDFLFQFVKQKAANELLYFSSPGTFSNQPVSVLDHYPSGNNIQQYTSGNNPSATTAQSLYTQSNAIIEDASFIRLKTIMISYNVPTDWLKGLQAKIYLQGQNLFTITPYSGPDPETQSLIYLPPLRQLTLGIQVGL